MYSTASFSFWYRESYECPTSTVRRRFSPLGEGEPSITTQRTCLSSNDERLVSFYQKDTSSTLIILTIMDINAMIRNGILSITTIPHMHKWPSSWLISGAGLALLNYHAPTLALHSNPLFSADCRTDAISYLSDRGNQLNWSKGVQTTWHQSCKVGGCNWDASRPIQ